MRQLHFKQLYETIVLRPGMSMRHQGAETSRRLFGLISLPRPRRRREFRLRTESDGRTVPASFSEQL